MQIMANAEIQSIVKIMGLQYGTVYTSVSGLRYGHLMIMADQDHDGSHIKGLVLNFLHHFWPSLLRLPGFLREFITPIVKVRFGELVGSLLLHDKCMCTTLQWPSYRAGCALHGQERATDIFHDAGVRRVEGRRRVGQWRPCDWGCREGIRDGVGGGIQRVVYQVLQRFVVAQRYLPLTAHKHTYPCNCYTTSPYAGLGTSTAAEAKEYFSALDRHAIDLAMDDADGLANPGERPLIVITA